MIYRFNYLQSCCTFQLIFRSIHLRQYHQVHQNLIVSVFETFSLCTTALIFWHHLRSLRKLLQYVYKLLYISRLFMIVVLHVGRSTVDEKTTSALIASCCFEKISDYFVLNSMSLTSSLGHKVAKHPHTTYQTHTT